MENEELINKLYEIKKEVTAVGFEYLQTKLPIHLDEFSKKMQPIIIIERAIEKAVNKIKNHE